MAPERNVEIVRWVVERGLGAGEIDAVLSMYSDEVVYHNPACEGDSPPRPGRCGIRRVLEDARRAYPGMVYSIDAVEAEDDWVALIYSCAPAPGAEPPGRMPDTSGAMFCRLRDGRIVEQWDLDDRLGRMQRYGGAGSDVEEEVDDVAALDEVGLALAPELPGLPHFGH